MQLSISEKVKIIMKRRGMSVADLAKATNQSPQNLANKFARDNFSEKESRELASALRCKLDFVFTLDDTGDSI